MTGSVLLDPSTTTTTYTSFYASPFAARPEWVACRSPVRTKPSPRPLRRRTRHARHDTARPHPRDRFYHAVHAVFVARPPTPYLLRAIIFLPDSAHWPLEYHPSPAYGHIQPSPAQPSPSGPFLSSATQPTPDARPTRPASVQPRHLFIPVHASALHRCPLQGSVERVTV